VNLNSKKALQVNQLGELSLNGERVDDSELGRTLLSSFYMDGHVCKAKYHGETILVEAHTFPLIVKNVELSQGHLTFTFHYGLYENVPVEHQFFLNDWSQICSFSKNSIPMLFSKAAQEQFYAEIVDSESYETYKIDGARFEFEDWYISNSDSLSRQRWSERYQTQHTPWDLDRHHPCLDWTLPRLKLSRSKILVPGCGRGHDAAKFYGLGHKVIGLDFSFEAIQEAKKRYEGVPFLHSDVFLHAQEHCEHYDVVFEHTLFCAMDTSARAKLVKTWSLLLNETGHLLGTFIVCNKREGPPFGVTEWELEALLSKHFKIEYWGRLRGKESAREGKELFVYAQKIR